MVFHPVFVEVQTLYKVFISVGLRDLRFEIIEEVAGGRSLVDVFIVGFADVFNQLVQVDDARRIRETVLFLRLDNSGIPCIGKRPAGSSL